MDYVIDYIEDYMSCYDVEQLRKEYKSGQYKKLSECPNYSTVKAYCQAINILVKEHYHSSYVKQYTVTPRQLMNI